MNDPIVAVEEIDLSTCETLAASLAAPPSGDVVLDCSAVRFIDSSGLRVIVEARDRLASQQRALILRRPSTVVTRLLEIMEMSDQFVVET